MEILWVIPAAGIFFAGCLVGANNPQWFKRNVAKLEAIANKVLAKAQQLKQKGLGG